MTLRRRDIVTVVPRSGDTATGAAGELADDVAELLFDALVEVETAGRPAARTSSLRMRPPTPVPDTRARSTPCSAASLRTMGVTYASVFDAAAGRGGTGEDTGAETTGAATGADGAGVATGAETTGAAGGGVAGAAEAPDVLPISAKRAPTGTVESTGTSIARTVPETGEGISVSTLSVETSKSASSTFTVSPTFLSQRVTVPSVTLSPSAGMVTMVPLEDATTAAADGAETGASTTGAGVAATGAGASTTGAGAAAGAGDAGAAPSAITANSAPTATV